ncbi:MAG: histidine phosphatase family protein [Chitinophagales bacterium]
MAKEIYIVRHGETEYNRQGIVQGRGVDSNLNEKGTAQGNAFYEHYQNLDFDAIYVSNQKRTHQTVARFADQQGYDLQRFTELDEISWGSQEGKKPSKERSVTYRKVVADWQNGIFDISVEDGETPLEVQNRLKIFLTHLQKQKQAKVLICTHGRTARILICTLLERSLTNMQQYTHQNTGLSKLTQKANGAYRLDKVGNLDHLPLDLRKDHH